jgi:predicted acylesterase/phospholipase RssA
LAVEKREGHKDEIHPFTSYAYERPEGEGDLSPRSPLNPALVYIHAAAQATSAAPGFFREANVLGDLFMDGAIMANNPSRWAWKEVWDMHFARRISANGCNPGPSSTVTEDHQNASQCPIGAFVSLGTGLRAPRSAFRRGDPLKKIRALLGKAIGDMTDTEEVHRDLQDRAGKLNKKLYYRFNPEGLEKMRLDECKSHDRTFHDMDTAWTRYVEKINVKRSLHECAQELVRQRRSRVSKEELLRFHDLTKLESRP